MAALRSMAAGRVYPKFTVWKWEVGEGPGREERLSLCHSYLSAKDKALCGT